jgi:hypothetical protein
MRPHRLTIAGLLAALLVVAAAAPGRAAGQPPDVSVRVDRTQIETKLGQKFDFRSIVSNRASTPASGLIAHLNVLSYDRSVYVDPEDWSSRRTRYLAPVAAHGSATITWKLQAVNSGRLAVYVSILSERPGAYPPDSSQVIHLTVAKRTTINSQGILPLALGIPMLLAGLAAGARVRRTRSSR